MTTFILIVWPSTLFLAFACGRYYEGRLYQAFLNRK
jgi:uncharacterized protein (DUF983 family)